MTLNEPQDYWIELLPGGTYRLTSELGECLFSKPATISGVAKLYTLSDESDLIYVRYSKTADGGTLKFGIQG